MSLQQKLDILHEAYLVPHAIKSSACKYNGDPNKIHIWRASLTGLEEDSEIILEDTRHTLAQFLKKYDADV